MLLSGSAAAYAAEAQPEPEHYLDLPLESLMDIEVYSVSKKNENIRQAAAAVFVITREDIRRMGVTSIPEALRVVPGLNVAQMDSNKWAITARGSNNQFANKLLVMIDGRSVYTPIFSGVYWDVQDTLLEDVERIEVIRGPGGTMWGANAVNGVINIITRKTKDTQGIYASALMGNYERGTAEARYGGKAGNNGHYRVYAKSIYRDETKNLFGGEDADDAWNRKQSGFRADWDEKDNDALTIQGDIYYGEKDSQLLFPSLSAPYQISRVNEDELSGGNLLGKWERTFSDTQQASLQVYYDYTRRDESLARQTISTFDTEFKHIWQWNDRNELVLGAGYRHITDEFNGSSFVSLRDASAAYDLWNTFIQNQYALMPERLFLTIGSKFEVNDFTGLEYQPSAKLSWHPHQDHTVWASVSRAVGLPSRLTDNVSVISSPIPAGILFPGSPSGFRIITGNGEVAAETLIAYELGYRATPSNRISVDAALFYNDYDDLITDEVSAVVLNVGTVPPSLTLPVTFDNLATGKAYGAELAAQWKATHYWALMASYAIQKVSTDLIALSTSSVQRNNEVNSPRHQITLQSRLDLPYNMQFDTMLHYVDDINALQSFEFSPSGSIVSDITSPDYWRFDARLGWKPLDHVELDLAGQNLLDDRHSEFGGPFYGEASEIGRSIFGRITLRY